MSFQSLGKLAASLTLILVVTAASRLAFGALEMRKISPQILATVSLETEAGSIGRSLAQGKGFSNPYERETGSTAILPPVYPLIVAAVFKLFGITSVASFRVLFVLNVLFAALTCIPIFRLGGHFGPGVGAIAAWIWALFPNGILIPFEWIWDSSLSAFLVAALLWLTVELVASPSLRRWVAYGLLWGFALMTNPSIGAALPFLLAWAAWRTRDQAGWRGAVLALGIGAACCIPWTVRNYSAFHRFIPLRSGFAFELYIGNNENYAEPRVWPPKISFEREQLRYIRIGEVAFMDEERAKAFTFIKTYPRVAVRLCALRLVAFWVGVADPMHRLRTEDTALNCFLVAINLLVPIATVAGLILLFLSRNTLASSMAAFPLLFPLVYYVTHASLRYRHIIDSCAFLLAAALLAELRRFATHNQQHQSVAT
jgi:hypothetical protein